MIQPEFAALSEAVILAVDDDRDSLMLLATILGEQGCVVRFAPTGRFALESARQSPPDLILLDIELPDLSGYEVCQQLKIAPTTAAIPVIFLSARQDPLDIVRAFGVGAVDYVTKPFAAAEVLARVRMHYSMQHLQQSLQTHVVQLEHEVLERQQAEQALEQQLNYARALSHCSQVLLAPTDKRDNRQSMLDEVLKTLCHSSGVAYMSIIQWHELYAPETSDSSPETYELSRYHLTLGDEQVDYSSLLHFTCLPAVWQVQLHHGEAVGGPLNRQELDANDWLQQCESFGIKSLLCIPFILKGVIWGYICAIDCNSYREWEATVVQFLRTAAKMLANTLEGWHSTDRLAERESQIRGISENLPNGMLYQIIQHPNGRIEIPYVAGAVERLIGYHAEQIIAQPELLFNRIAEQDIERFVIAMVEAARTLTLFEFETSLYTPQYEMHWVQFSSTPRRMSNGATIWDGILIDLTVRKGLEAALQKSEEQFRRIFEQNPVGMAMGALNYRFIYVNETLCKITGYSREELLASGLRALAHPEDRDIDIDLVEQLADGEIEQYTIEKRYLRKDGRIVWANVNARVMHDSQNQPQYYLVLLEDISARKQAEEALRLSEERYRRLFESSLDAIVITDEHDIYLDANQAAATLFGIPREQLLGVRGIDLSATPKAQAMEEYREYLQRGYERAHFTFRRSDGILRIAEYTAARIGPAMHQTILRDITDQKAAEEELKRARLAAEEATRVKSEFVAQISHEIRTPMNAIIGLTTLLLSSPLNRAQRDDIEMIRRNGNALLMLIDDILDFSKIEAGKLSLEYHPFSLRECIEDALDLLAPLADAKQLQLRYFADPSLPDEVISDQARLRQILVNLLSNAIKFTERGVVEVRLTGGRRLDTPSEAPIWDIAIAVHDTGIGISSMQLTRIFQPFVQATAATSRRYGGSGLGLAICQRLIDLMGGGIQASSIPGQGSTFTVELAVSSTAVPLPRYLTAEQPVLVGRHVLVLANQSEDSQQLIQQLQLWSMEVIVMTAPADAMSFVRNRNPVDIVVLAWDDTIVSTIALAEQLRGASRYVRLPIICWTVVSQRSQARSQLRLEDLEILPLPIRPSSLHETLTHMLQNDSSSTVSAIDQFDVMMGELHPLRILLSEDNTTNQQVARRLLSRLGYQVDIAVNGLEVLQSLRRQSYDLVLMDVQMPEMSGTEATNYIRTFWPASYQPRIAAMTAYASEENRTWLLNTGMDDYVRKPVRLEELVRVLQATIAAPPVSNEGWPLGIQSLDEDTGLIDHSILTTFLSSVSEADSVIDTAFVADYVADLDAQLAKLQAALVVLDVTNVMRAAHTLKGLSLQIGAMDLAICWGRIEAAAQERSMEQRADLLTQAELLYAAVRQVLIDYSMIHQND